MTTMLDQLIESIHPTRTRELIRERMDEALNSFRIANNTVADAIQYRDTLCRFIRHLDHRLGFIPISAPRPDGVLWQRASDLLRKAYGPRGELAAYQTQCNGAEGGLYGVLRRLASEAADQRITEQVSLRIDAFCQRLSATEYLALGQEYLQKHGHLLPAEMREGFGGRARLNLAGLLKEHHRLLVATNRVGR